MTKFIQAKDILKAKNFIQNRFDTNGFLNEVAQFFLENEVNATLYILSERFVDIDPDNESQKEYRIEYQKGIITQEDKDKGYKAVMETIAFDQSHYKDWGDSGINYYWRDVEQGYFRPRIIIDKPFVRNAVFALRTLAGYTVERVRKRGETHYEVTLV
jgi:hypothetical protein